VLTLRAIAGVALSLAFAGCGDNEYGGIDYLGEPPAVIGPELGDSACDAVFACGVINVTCDPLMMIAEAVREPAVHFYGSRDVCDTMQTTYYTDLVAGCAAADLSDDERDQINTCLNAAWYCPADADLQAVADASCAGLPLPGYPESCTFAKPLIDHCLACAANPASC